MLFTEVAKSGMVSQAAARTSTRQGIDAVSGRARTYSDLKGYALTPKFVFIDGRTGAQLYSETFHEEALYPTDQNTPALSSYFELMDKLLPSFLNTLSTQKIRGHPDPAQVVGLTGGLWRAPRPLPALPGPAVRVLAL